MKRILELIKLLSGSDDKYASISSNDKWFVIGLSISNPKYLLDTSS